MFKSSLLSVLILSAGSAAAATMSSSVSVTCFDLPGGTHSTTNIGPSGASCQNPGDSFHPSVFGVVSDTPAQLYVQLDSNTSHGVQGQAYLHTTYNFTVTGAAGIGFFAPCVAVLGYRGLPRRRWVCFGP